MIIRFEDGILALTIASTVLAAQPSAAPPVSAPLRELPWGQINFLHTTDTHGWHAGHLQEWGPLSLQLRKIFTDLEADHPSAPIGVTTYHLQKGYTRKPMRRG